MNFLASRNVRTMTRSMCARNQSAAFSSKHSQKFPTVQMKKMMTLGALLVFVGGVYLTAITKMKQTDELGTLMDKETLITEKDKWSKIKITTTLTSSSTSKQTTFTDIWCVHCIPTSRNATLSADLYNPAGSSLFRIAQHSIITNNCSLFFICTKFE